jgi:hypothetical protein
MLGLGGLAQGILGGVQTGLALNRQDRLDAQAADEHNLRMQTGQEQLQQQKATNAYTQQEQQQALNEQGFQTNLTAALRKVMPLVDSGNTAPAMSVLEDQFNNNPAFKNGYTVSFQKDANGVPLADKDGNYSMTLTNPDGSTLKPVAIAPKDAVLSFANMASPQSVIAGQRADEAKAAEIKAETAKGLILGDQKVQGSKAVAQIEADARVRAAQIHAATEANSQKYQMQPAEARLFTFYQGLFPKKTPEELLTMVHTSKAKSDQQQRNEMMMSLIRSGQADSLEDAARQVAPYIGSEGQPASPALSLTPPGAAPGAPAQKNYSNLWEDN